MGANSQFLALLPKQSTDLNVLYLLFILISLVCLGGLLEGRRNYALAEGRALGSDSLYHLLDGNLVRRNSAIGDC